MPKHAVQVGPFKHQDHGRSGAEEAARRFGPRGGEASPNGAPRAEPRPVAGWAEIIGADEARALLLDESSLNARAALDGPALGWTPAPVAARPSPRRRFEVAPQDADRIMTLAIAAAVALLAWVITL